MASSADIAWMDDIRNKLTAVFGEGNAEGLIRVLFYLDEEENGYKNDDRIAPTWKTLRSTMYSDAIFRKYAERLIEDTKSAEKDPQFRLRIQQVYEQMMDASDDPLTEADSQGFELVRLTDADVIQRSSFMQLAKAWPMIADTCGDKVLWAISKVVTNQKIMCSLDEAVSLVSKTGGTVAMVTLAAIYLSAVAIRSLYRWWKGEITGKRCLKNIFDATFTMAAGAAGGLAGSTLGALGGPIGMVAGGVIGGIVSSATVNFIIDRATQTLFGIPKDEALENAYNFLGVQMTASNHEINTEFRQLCLKHHPDKGGCKEDFHMVQLNMAVIKAARGELY